MPISSRRLRSWYIILKAIPRHYLKAATFYGFHPVAGLRALVAALQARYTPQEAWMLGLLQPGSDARTDRRYMSGSRSRALQFRLNPASWRVLLDDKAIFYRFCAALGVRTPRLYGILLRRSAGWSHTGACPAGEESWTRYLEQECPGDIVVKPALGSFGHGVRVLRRTGALFEENTARTLDAATLVRELLADPVYESFVIQERVRSHEDIVRLSGSEGLQTARIFTVTGDERGPRVIYAFFKVIVGANAIDNYVRGKTGNLVARIRTDNGTLYPTVTTSGGWGFQPVPVHPVTGAAAEGFRLPFWRDACDLVLAAAPLFLPLRSIGWDVALTPTGPVIIEANSNSDPPNAAGAIHEMLAGMPQDALSEPH